MIFLLKHTFFLDFCLKNEFKVETMKIMSNRVIN